MSGPEKPFTDYKSMDGPTLLAALGDDASKWAEAFCQIKQAMGWGVDDIDEGLMIGWFANAIENSSDVRERRMLAARDGDTRPAVSETDYITRLFIDASSGPIK